MAEPRVHFCRGRPDDGHRLAVAIDHQPAPELPDLPHAHRCHGKGCCLAVGKQHRILGFLGRLLALDGVQAQMPIGEDCPVLGVENLIAEVLDRLQRRVETDAKILIRESLRRNEDAALGLPWGKDERRP
ncbi:hypothetical protein D3C72_2008740 [compost metagenome]